MRALAMSLLVVSACSFSTSVEVDPTAPAPDALSSGQPGGAARRCEANVALCVDFEVMSPRVHDEAGAMIEAQNLLQLPRGETNAGMFQPNTRVRVPESTKLDLERLMTVELWTMPVQIPNNTDRQYGLFDNHLQYAINFQSDRRIECTIGDSESLDSDNQISLGAWHHVACTYDGAQLRVYVDGRVRRCKNVQLGVPTLGTFGSAIGANMDIGPAYKNAFVGQLDDVHVYPRALSASEICTLWGKGNCSDACP